MMHCRQSRHWTPTVMDQRRHEGQEVVMPTRSEGRQRYGSREGCAARRDDVRWLDDDDSIAGQDQHSQRRSRRRCRRSTYDWIWRVPCEYNMLRCACSRAELSARYSSACVQAIQSGCWRHSLARCCGVGSSATRSSCRVAAAACQGQSAATAVSTAAAALWITAGKAGRRLHIAQRAPTDRVGHVCC
jgi:hypothetical protein